MADNKSQEFTNTSNYWKPFRPKWETTLLKTGRNTLEKSICGSDK